MTDNRTNGPNKYAGFLARQNHQRDSWRGVGAKCLCGKVFDLDADHALHQVEEIMRAALEAAAGAAPQAECDCGAGPGSAICKRVCATRAQAQPSSTVDEAALIREAKAEAWGEGYDEWAQAPAGDQPPRDNPYREGSET